MENLVASEPSWKRDVFFVFYLRQAYDKNIKLIILHVYVSLRLGMARQGYMEVMGTRMCVLSVNKE